MMRITLVLIALLMGACAQAPFTPAEKIPAVNLKPVRERIVAIKTGNERIGAKLEDTRAKLDAAIVEAHNANIDREKLDKNLKDTSDALNAAIAEKKAQAELIQFAAVDLDRAQEEADTFKLRADAQTAELTELRKYTANYKAQEKLDHRWWGIGYFIHGAKYLGLRLLLVGVGLSIIGFLLNTFVPFLAPFFAVILKFFLSIPGRIWAFIKGLFRKTPP